MQISSTKWQMTSAPLRTTSYVLSDPFGRGSDADHIGTPERFAHQEAWFGPPAFYLRQKTVAIATWAWAGCQRCFCSPRKKLPPSEWTLPWHNMAMLKKVHHALSGATATVPTVTSPERVNRSNYWICVGLGSVPLWPTESHGATLQHTSSYIMELGKPQLPWFGG